MASLKDQLMRHLTEEVYCRLGISKTHGVGVFSIRPIPKGTFPLKTRARQTEVRITRDELAALPKGVITQLKRFCYHEKGTYYVPSSGFNTMDLAVYLNHSKKPNLRFTKKGVLEALKDIRKGEELTIDYDESFGGNHQF
jgi:SET domain-containing protein